MPTSYRSSIIALAGLGTAIVGSGIGVYYLDNPVVDQTRSQEQISPTHKIPPPAERIARALEAIEKEQNSAESSERARRDLDAQEGAWRWAKWTAWAAFVQLLLSGAGIAFVVLSLRQGQAGLTAARRALSHAKISNEIARDTAKQQLRAYLGFHSAWIEGSGNLWQFKLINNGQTPAKSVAVKIVTVARGTIDSTGMERHQLGQIDPAYKRRGMIRTPAVVVQNGDLCMGVHVVAAALYEDSFGQRWCRRQIFELCVGDASIDGTDAHKHYLHLRTSRERKVPTNQKA